MGAGRSPAAVRRGQAEFLSLSSWDNRGWGFGVSIVARRDDLSATPGRYGGDGGYGTSWYVDPTEALVGIPMTQRLWESASPPPAQLDFWTAAYQAIEE